MNLHTKLSDHLRKHEYKRGAFKGDAPADASRRSRSHYRVVRYPTHMAVRFHSTNIIRAFPDGSLILDANGWASSPTTRDAYAGWGFYLGSTRHGSHTQTCLRPCRTYDGPMVPFEDGMKLQYDSVRASYYLHPDYIPKPFMARVADKDERREFRNDEDVMAFRQALPLLHAAVTAMPLPERNTLRWELRCMPRDLHRACESHSKWPAIVAAYWRTTPSETWSAYYADAVKGMTTLVEVL